VPLLKDLEDLELQKHFRARNWPVPRELCRHPSPNWPPVKDPTIGKI